jgi:hypothetical protein
MIQIEFISPKKNAEIVRSVNGQIGDVVLDIPKIDGLATEEYVAKKIAEAQMEGADVDLSDYYTKSEVDAAIEEIELTPGPAGEPGKDGEDYVLTDEDKAEIAGMVEVTGGGSVSVDGTTIVQNEDGTISATAPIKAGTGTDSIMTSNATDASGSRSLVIGYKASSSGFGGMAVGYDTKASATSAIAIGNGATATKANAISIGICAEAKGEDTLALGHGAKTASHGSYAIGSSAQATSQNTMVVGHHSTATASYAYAFGNYLTADTEKQMVIGHHNVSDPTATFIIGNGANNLEQQNAMVVDSSNAVNFPGSVTIGADKAEVATKAYVEEAVANAGGSAGADLSDYYTKSEVDAFFSTETVLYEGDITRGQQVTLTDEESALLLATQDSTVTVTFNDKSVECYVHEMDGLEGTGYLVFDGVDVIMAFSSLEFDSSSNTLLCGVSSAGHLKIAKPVEKDYYAKNETDDAIQSAMDDAIQAAIDDTKAYVEELLGVIENGTY